MRPSILEILIPVNKNTPKSTAAIIDIGQSRLVSSLLAASGHKIALIPATANKLKILEPKTLPTAISFAPFKAAVKLTASSGAEDQKQQ